MRQISGPKESSAEKHVQAIKRQARRKFSAEEKIRIVLEGLRGEYSIAELCRREGIAQGLYYTWSKEFLEAGKKRLSGDTERLSIYVPTTAPSSSRQRFGTGFSASV